MSLHTLVPQIQTHEAEKDRNRELERLGIASVIVTTAAGSNYHGRWFRTREG